LNNQLPIDNPRAIQLLSDIIREIIQQEIKKAPFNFMMSAIVTNVGSGVADVQLTNSGNTITNVKNKTGETLLANDEVYVEFINGSNSNFYIALKK
jgi:hypothetical protein